TQTLVIEFDSFEEKFDSTPCRTIDQTCRKLLSEPCVTKGTIFNPESLGPERPFCTVKFTTLLIMVPSMTRRIESSIQLLHDIATQRKMLLIKRIFVLSEPDVNMPRASSERFLRSGRMILLSCICVIIRLTPQCESPR